MSAINPRLPNTGDSTEAPAKDMPKLPPRPNVLLRLNTDSALWIKGSKPSTIIDRSSFSTEHTTSPSRVSLSVSQATTLTDNVVNAEPPPPISFLQQAVKTAKTAVLAFNNMGDAFRRVGKGAAKRVWIFDNPSKGSDKAFLTPIAGFFERLFGRKDAEIRQEVKTAAKIKSSSHYQKISGESNVAANLTEVKKEDRIDGQYTVETDKAGNVQGHVELNHLVRDRTATTMQRIGYCCQILNGINNVHESGHAHGDLKGDNFLIYEQEGSSIIRVSDFGKTKELANEHDSFVHTGNMLYAPPEARSSIKGEIYSAALLVVRILEEEFLDDTNPMLKKPDSSKINTDSSKLRGIERFVVENDKCRQTNSNSFLGKLRVLKGVVAASVKRTFMSSKEKAAAEAEVQGYINELFVRMNAKPDLTSAQKAALTNMHLTLDLMVRSDPKQRPPMDYCLNLFQQALAEYQGSSANPNTAAAA